MKFILDILTGRYFIQGFQHVVLGNHTYEDEHVGYVECTNTYCDSYYFVPVKTQ
jgi:hypothetical protein